MKPTKHSCCEKCMAKQGVYGGMCIFSHCECHMSESTTGQDYAGPSGVQVACGCPTKHCKHYESDFDRFVKETDWSEIEKEFDERFRMEDAAREGKGIGHGLNAEIKAFFRTHLEAAYLKGLAASSSDAQDGAYQNGLIAGRKKGRAENLEWLEKEVDKLFEYVVQNADTKKNTGYEVIITVFKGDILALIQARKAGGDN